MAGWQAPWSSHPSGPGRWRQPLVVVAALVVATGLAACDPTPVQVQGTITTANGSNAAGVTVTLYADETTPIASSTTDALGGYAFHESAGIPDGAYRLRIGTAVWWPDASSWATAGDIHIATGAVAVHDATLDDVAATVTGTVVDGTTPVESAVVGLYTSTPLTLVATTVTGPDGAFQLDALSPGDHEIRLGDATRPLIAAGGATPAVFPLTSATTAVGTIDITTGAITAAPSGPTYRSVTAGRTHSCAVTTDDALTCWGTGSYGQATPPDGAFDLVSGGDDHNCALATDQTLACWGRYVFSGLATPPTGTYKAVTAGQLGGCAVATDDTLDCWGTDTFGLLSPPAGTFTSVSTFAHTCAVATDQTLACWGQTTHGKATPPAGTFLAVSAGGDHSCAIATDQTLACWGRNLDGRITPPPGTFTSLAAGASHTCAIATDQTLACWGTGTFAKTTPPSGTFESVAAGTNHSCAIATDHTLTCWGDDTYGQATPPAGT